MEALKDDLVDLCNCQKSVELLRDRGFINYMDCQVIKKKIATELDEVLKYQKPKFKFGKKETKQHIDNKNLENE